MDTKIEAEIEALHLASVNTRAFLQLSPGNNEKKTQKQLAAELQISANTLQRIRKTPQDAKFFVVDSICAHSRGLVCLEDFYGNIGRGSPSKTFREWVIEQSKKNSGPANTRIAQFYDCAPTLMTVFSKMSVKLRTDWRKFYRFFHGTAVPPIKLARKIAQYSGGEITVWELIKSSFPKTHAMWESMGLQEMPSQVHLNDSEVNNL